MLMNSIFQDDIMLIVLWQRGTQNTPAYFGHEVNVTVILTLNIMIH